MKALRVLVPLVLAGILVVAVTLRISHRSDAEAYRTQREALRRELVERSTVARGLADPAGVEEARAVLRWWVESSAALRGRFASAAREDVPAGRRTAVGKEGGQDASAWFRYAEERSAALRAGYAPILAGAQDGLRLDILAFRPGEHPDTHERALRIDFAVWGAPRRLEREAAGEGQRASSRVVVPLAFRQIGFRFVDASGKTYGEMAGTGEPYLVLKDPERFSTELPPGVAFGTWWVDLFPREAARVELTVNVQVQGMSAATLAPSFRWELRVADDWKLRPGEAFHAEPRSAPPETPGRR